VDIIKLDSSKAFFDEVLALNFREFMNTSSSFSTAINMASSLFHMHEWVYSLDKAAAEKALNTTFSAKHEVWKYVEANVSQAGYIRDVANAAKHVVLTKRPSTSMTHIANTAVVSVGWGEGGYGQGRYSAPSVMMEEGTGQVSLDTCAKAVFGFWEDLVKRL